MVPFKTSVDIKHIPTVNNMYLTRRNGGRYLNPEYADTKHLVRNKLIKSGIVDYIDKIEDIDNYVLHIDIVFVYHKRFNARDASNSIKLVEDAIVLATNLDDSLHYSVTATKLQYDDIPNHKLEIVYISVLPKLKSDLLWEHSKWRKEYEHEYR